MNIVDTAESVQGNTVPSAKKKRTCYDVSTKRRAIEMSDEGRKKIEIALELDIPLNTLSAWLKQRSSITNFKGLPSAKCMVNVAHPELEEALVTWINAAKSSVPPIVASGSLIRAKAKEVAQRLGISDFVASSGWFYKFAARNRLRNNNA